MSSTNSLLVDLYHKRSQNTPIYCRCENDVLSHPKNSPKSGDRFVPALQGPVDLELSRFTLLSEGENKRPSLSWPGSNSPDSSPASDAFKTMLASELFREKAEHLSTPESPNTKILSFSRNVEKVRPYTPGSLRSLYTKGPLCTVGESKSRTIPLKPESVLDAPGMVDDYYLNLLDWGRNGLLAVALSSSAYLYDPRTASIVHIMETKHGEMVTSLKWMSGHDVLAIGLNTGVVQIWDTKELKQLRSLYGQQARVGSLSWNKHILACGSRDTSIFLHDVRVPSHHISTLRVHSQEVCGLEWDRSGTYLASGGNDNNLNIWEPHHSTSDPLYVLRHHCAAVKALSWCPWQANLLASGGGSADRCIRFWSARTGGCVNTVDTHSQVTAIRWAPHYKELISSHGFSQNQLRVWAYPSMKTLAELKGHTCRVLHAVLSPDGSTIVSAAGDETLRFWNVWPRSKHSPSSGTGLRRLERLRRLRGSCIR